MQTLLVTGGVGFIGANFILKARKLQWANIINLDKLTYASNLQTLVDLKEDPNYCFIQGDINNSELIGYILEKYQPDGIINFAAESHVDRSIYNPENFIKTNILGTFNLLENIKKYWQKLTQKNQIKFRFLHISTDEVYGSLNVNAPPFKEDSSYVPSSPYAASKASADHLVRSYYHTYGLPTLTTHCSNNYGPFQFPEKLIPLTILNALNGKKLPIYGDGQNIRDWLYVADNCDALYLVFREGAIGETYNIGGLNEQTNLAVVEKVCAILDNLVPQSDFHYSSLIEFIKDRPGHDQRYAINCNKIYQNLGWQPKEDFDSGLLKTVQWYLNNPTWVNFTQTDRYYNWIKQNYDNR